MDYCVGYRFHKASFSSVSIIRKTLNFRKFEYPSLSTCINKNIKLRINIAQLSKFDDEIIEDRFIDDDDENEGDTHTCVEKLQSIYQNIFFYGMEIPNQKGINLNRDKLIRNIPKSSGLNRIFFTPTELMASQLLSKKNTLISNVKSSVVDDKDIIQERRHYLSRLLSNMEEDLELIEAALKTISKDDVTLKREYEKKRIELIDEIQQIKIEYINLVAESY